MKKGSNPPPTFEKPPAPPAPPSPRGQSKFADSVTVISKRHNEMFEAWLRTTCFQKPTPEAYDLAKSAWNAALDIK